MAEQANYTWDQVETDQLDEMRAAVHDFVTNELDNGPGWIIKRRDGKNYEINVAVTLSRPY